MTRSEQPPIEVITAYVMGVALPVLETARRGADFSDLPAYVDDFLVGALLLVAARAAHAKRPHGLALLAAAWGVLCGGIYYSVFGQLASTTAYDISGLPHGAVIGMKLAMASLALNGLVLSVRRAGREAT